MFQMGERPDSAHAPMVVLQPASSPAVPLPSLASLGHRCVPDIVQEQAFVQQGLLQPTSLVPPGVWDVVLPLQSLAAAIGGPCMARASKRKCRRRLQRCLDRVPGPRPFHTPVNRDH